MGEEEEEAAARCRCSSGSMEEAVGLGMRVALSPVPTLAARGLARLDGLG